MAIAVPKIEPKKETTAVPKIAEPPTKGPNAGFATPGIQTGADVQQSERITKGSPVPQIQPPVPSAPVGTGAVPSAAPTPSQPSTPNPASPPTYGNTGGTPAPTAGAGGSATVPVATGAPPGVPQTGLPLAPPLNLNDTLKSVVGSNAGEEEYNQATNEYNRRLAEAAYNYNGGPDSAVAKARLSAEGGLRRATANRGVAGTIESSLYGGDQSLIANTQARANLEALDTYNKSIREADDAIAKAQIVWNRVQEERAREQAEQAEKREPTVGEANPAPPPPPAVVGAGTPIPGVANPTPTGPAPPGMEWTPSGGGGWVPKGTKVVRTY